MAAGPGRPRLSSPLRVGDTAREQILDAAAELFTTGGYASTSTRAVADAVGIRQASLYHHFATKDDLLEELLVPTVGPTLDAGERLRRAPGDTLVRAGARLHALALFDGRQLLASRWNLGALYLLPELRTPRFAPFRAHREQLRALYGAIGVDLAALTAAPPRAGLLAFALVEALISARADGADTTAEEVADACLRLAGVGASQLDAVLTASRELLATLAAPPPAAARERPTRPDG